MRRPLIALAVTVGTLLTLPSAAAACSKDDAAYFDGFPDASCLLELQSTEIDTFGGLRLVTDGEVSNAVWDDEAGFSNGISYEGRTFAPVGVSTLDVDGTGAAARLKLPDSPLPLAPAGGPGLNPAASTWLDSDGVSDPAVVKAGALYVLYYAGVAEDGSGPAIFRLTSADGTTWARPADPAQHRPVLEGTAGGFDENGVYGPDVVYDAADTAAPYKMWFSGRGDTFDQIGYATSTDGVTWTKRADPVVTVGLPGSQDSFSAAHPTVLFDSGLWKMWYEGDDSNKKSIGYATSTDGIAWSKAGAVVESGTGNVEFGVFAPAVWKDGATFRMLVGGRKETNDELQTKLINYSSTDGLIWTAGSIALNTGGFAGSNLSSPELVVDGTTQRLYYSGNDANEGDARDRIGYATGTGGTAAQTPMLDIAPRSTTIFDAREVSGVAAVRPGGVPDHLAGVYWGLNEDGIPRLGGAYSSDRHNWFKVAGPKPLGAILAVGANNQFDEGGHRDPSLVHDPVAGAADDYFLAFTAIDGDGRRTIGMSTTDELPTSLLPDHSTWSKPVQILGPGTAGTFDAGGVSHPSLAKVGPSTYLLIYTATDAAGKTSFGRAVSSSPTSPFTGRAQVILTGAATCDPDGRRDPVLRYTGGESAELFYVGIENLDFDGDGVTDETIERICHATLTGDSTFARDGVIINPSQIPYSADESGVAPASLVAGETGITMFTTVTDRDGRMRGSSAGTDLPIAETRTLANGWATYQLGDAETAAKDFRFIEGVSTGHTELWMSVLQPYSTPTRSYWSDYFPVDAATTREELNFLLSITAVRWQVRLREFDTPPSLDRLTIGHAPVHFAPAGTATTKDITPPAEFVLQSWTTLTLVTELFAPLNTGTGAGTATVLDPEGNVLVAATPLSIGTADQSISLSGIDAAVEPKLRVKLDLTSATGQASPIVRSLKVGYVALQPQKTPTPTPTPTPTATPAPPPPAVLTLVAGAPKITYGRTTTLSGRLTVGANGIAGASIAILQQPRGTTAPKPLTTVTTDATGAFTTTIKPVEHTVYTAVLATVTSPAPVRVQVRHRISLKVALSGRAATFTGKLGPRHANRRVTLQRKSGTRWVRFARVRTTRRSTFRFTKRLARGRHRFRATTAADLDHLIGRSAARRIRVR